jgi:hypothetical protein
MDPPNKYVKGPDGKMMLNPEYTAWKKNDIAPPFPPSNNEMPIAVATASVIATPSIVSYLSDSSDDERDTNDASGQDAHVSGGLSNVASGPRSTIGGGADNKAIGEKSTISGGQRNKATKLKATVSGGAQNKAVRKRNFLILLS